MANVAPSDQSSEDFLLGYAPVAN